MNDFKFAMHLMTHPFDGYWDMKYEKKGKLKVAMWILLGVVLTMIFEHLVRGFLYNMNKNVPVNIMSSFRNVALLFILWSVANWSITTLMDGEGSLKDIMMATGYAVLPYILIRIPMAIITNFMTLDQVNYVNFIDNVSMLWVGLLIFAGIMTVHQYSVSKTIFTLLLTIVAMGVIVFICMVFFNLIWQIAAFLTTIYKEIMLRL